MCTNSYFSNYNNNNNNNDDDDDDDDDNNISTMNSYIRIVATQCSLKTWFVSGI